MDFTNIEHEDIAARARTIWEQQGQPEGRDLEHWLQAEVELRRERAQSDLVGSQIPLKEGMTESVATATPVAPQAASPKMPARSSRRRSGGAK